MENSLTWNSQQMRVVLVLLTILSQPILSLLAQEIPAEESAYLSNIRQLTLEGKRAGEGYFSADGKQLVFQSEREAANPFYQIYLLDLETGDLERVSTGTGKTTCAWIHPSGQQVLFAGTQDDPLRLTKQKEELEFRASGNTRRYAWDYDSEYELYVWDKASKAITRLTRAIGYDAEGSFSPDGKQVVFASNRNAYRTGGLDAAEQKSFEVDPARFVDLFIMNSDGSNVRQLTDGDGYDGGPFFSSDGERICWRRFATDGATAEIFTMKVDGSDIRQLTRLNAMSWAPFFHPSNDYLVFTTNLHGFGNFELYVVRADGEGTPLRVSFTEGFDGLPVFSPDGQQLAWTSVRGPGKQSQIFLAKWNDSAVRTALKLDRQAITEAPTEAKRAWQLSSTDFSPTDVVRHVDYLCRPELGGRMTGTQGEQLATGYVAAYLENLGYSPAGVNGTFFHPFDFPAGVELGKQNHLTHAEERYELDQQWRPIAFSKEGAVEASPVMFAGYGIVTPEGYDGPAYDSFVHLDVRDRWVMVLRGLPNNLSDERRQQLSAFSSLRFKAMTARDRGARGLIVVNGPHSNFKEKLVPLRSDQAAGASLAIISVSNDLAATWLQRSKESLSDLQKELDDGSMMMGFEVKEFSLAASIDLERQVRTGRNVLARLKGGKEPHAQMVLLGAHIDHLGSGFNNSSLAREDERDGIHRGADDNASGVGAMLEIAQFLAEQQRAGKISMKRDLVVAAWSGEELGLLGSEAYANAFYDLNPHVLPPTNKHTLYPAMAACLNLDMVGRLREKLVMQGVGSSPDWKGMIEQRNAPLGMSLTLQSDSYLPTDAKTFFMRGVPILSAFTGSHSEYHTPRDVPETLNYEGAAQAAKLIGLLGRGLLVAESPPAFSEQTAPEKRERAQLTAYLGTVPDYSSEDIVGVKLGGVAKDGPADKGGLRGGDIIVQVAGKKIENIYDYTYAIGALKPGKVVDIVVERGAETVSLQVIPASRD
jgi:Tol biopolymer transport system component